MDIIYGKSNKVVEGRSTTLYTYTATGRFKSVVDALGRKETYEYDQYGRLKTKTDRDNYATTYEYNNAGVVTKVGYADGRSVAFSYNELNQLSQINDWYGKTILENDILGRLTKVTDFKNRTVAYEYGATGERTKLIYPDGREVTYNYDEKLQLSSIIGNGEETRYTYDDLGRLSGKTFANGVTQGYTYMPGGNLASMESSDKQGTLDKYFYSYNNAGLISGIDRNRRGLDKVSGRYEYSYDAIGRLTKTTHDGITKASYEYDAFGNRTAMSEIAADTSENIKTAYTYDVLDRLIETKELNSSQAILKTYDYDKRGNQTKEFINGLLQKTFTFDATNMLSKVVDKDKGELENHYNGLGFRVASIRPEESIEYLCDLSKDYYNLLERTVNGETESFVYDNNVISMSKSGNNFYYLQDELGSPMYMTGTDGVAISSYAFDDFGRNIDPFTGNRRDRNQKHAYTTNGNIIQPFAFTGYQEDEVSGLKFAQARFYSADNGRFIGEDQVRGFKLLPETQNHYLYCCNEPIEHVDDNGKFVHIIAGAVIGAAVSVGAALVTGAVTGDMPSIGAVAASAVGGAVGGAITAAFPTSIIAGGVGAAASTFVTDNLTNMWGEEDEKKSMGEIVADTAVSGALGAAFGAAQKFELNEKVADGVKDLFHTSGKVNKIIDGVFIGEWRGITTDAPGSWKTNVRDAVRGARSRNGFLGFSKKTWGKALACAFLGEANVVGVVNNTISNVASNIVTNIAKHITGVNSSSIDGYCVA